MQQASGNILVIDDDADVLGAAQLLLKRHFAQVRTGTDPKALPALLAEQDWDLVLLDMNFGIGANSGAEGLQWLAEIQLLQPGLPVILMTAYGAVDTAVRAMKQGAIDFVLKPWHNERLLTTIRNALRLRQSEQEVSRLKSRAADLVPGNAGDRLIGQSAAMRRVLQLIERAAPTDANVLILGANGTGKELVARELWRRSLRKDEAFVSVDLGAVSESLFESELFGHRKGAFTGAVSDRTGRLQAASGGTLFLDEIGNLPLHLQNKLLTVLEQRQVVPVGSNKPVPIDVRLICATNMPLQRMMQEGSFREDLYYRINTVELPLPALHERPEDIIPLLEYYLGHYAHKYRMPAPRLAPGAQAALRAHRWPGNVRELRHAAERAVILGGGEELTASTLLPVQAADATPLHALPPDTGATLNLEELEREAVATALRLHAGNISQAAKALGITRTALYRRMEKHGL